MNYVDGALIEFGQGESADLKIATIADLSDT